MIRTTAIYKATMNGNFRTLVAGVALFMFATAGCDTGHKHHHHHDHQHQGDHHHASADDSKSVKPGINDNYKNADVDEWKTRFESESREIYTERKRIVDAVNPNPGTKMADVGAGTGFLAEMFADRVTTSGTVYAVDITPEFIDHIASRARATNRPQIKTVLCKEDSVELPANSVDLVFMCDTYHHLEYPKSTMRTVHEALRPGGELFVIDFERIEGKSREWILGHVRAGEETVVREITDCGFVQVDGPDDSFLDENYMLKFRKR